MSNNINNTPGISHQETPIKATNTQITSAIFANKAINVIPNYQAYLSKAQSAEQLEQLLCHYFSNKYKKHIKTLLSQTTHDRVVYLLRQKRIKIMKKMMSKKAHHFDLIQIKSLR